MPKDVPHTLKRNNLGGVLAWKADNPVIKSTQVTIPFSPKSLRNPIKGELCVNAHPLHITGSRMQSSPTRHHTPKSTPPNTHPGLPAPSDNHSDPALLLILKAALACLRGTTLTAPTRPPLLDSSPEAPIPLSALQERLQNHPRVTALYT